MMPRAPIIATHAGRCAACHNSFPEDEPIVSTPEGWAHAVCPEEKPLGAVCADCFTEIASNGECLC